MRFDALRPPARLKLSSTTGRPLRLTAIPSVSNFAVAVTEVVITVRPDLCQKKKSAHLVHQKTPRFVRVQLRFCQPLPDRNGDCRGCG